MAAETATLTPFPKQAVTVPAPKLNEEKRRALGDSLWTSITEALGDRQGVGQMEDQLTFYRQLYELQVGPKNFPWPGSSNLCMPISRVQCDEVVSRVCQTCFTQRFFQVSGNTPKAAQFAQTLERYYNVKLYELNWIEPLRQYVHL